MNLFKSALLGNDMVWAMAKPTAVALGDYFRKCRSAFVRRRLLESFADGKVAAGIFAGMKYPEFKSHGSSLLPKLLGTYEKELTPCFETAFSRDYSTIVDVGCAEGYYTVGLALKFPQAKVHAFDIAEKARALCKGMAEANGVAERVVIGGECSAETLAKFDFGKRGLVILDCEGAERHLVSEANLANFKNCDLLIELHDMVDRSISGYIKNLFAATHKITVVHSVDDLQKAHCYKSPLVEERDIQVRKAIFAEGRAEIMEWVFLEPLR